MKSMRACFFLFLFFALGGVCAAQEKNSLLENSFCLIRTSRGDITVELFSQEAPLAVSNFIGLAEGKKTFIDAATGAEAMRPFYDGLIFHRVIKGFMIQGGCPKGDGTGNSGFVFEDEIDAKSLHLDEEKAYDPEKGPHPYLMIRDEDSYFSNLVIPLSRKMGIKTAREYESRLDEIDAKIKEISLKEALENLGYRYKDKGSSHKMLRGVLAMANAGPNTNSSQFFITVADAPWLSGRHTVFGRVVKGMEVADAISAVPVNAASRPLDDIKIISVRACEKPLNVK